MGLWERIIVFFRRHRPDETDRLLGQFQSRLGYRFRDGALLRVALTHRSHAKTHENEWLPSNERLEFLGDSVLGLVTSEFLYREFPDKPEGGLTKRKSLLVNEGTLFRAAGNLDLGRFILLSPEEDRAGGRSLPSINADALEALIGALYLDGGLDAARPFVQRVILSRMDEIVSDKSFHNYKGDLLELLQAQGRGMPRYEVADELGPDHDKTFTVEVYCNGDRIGLGTGQSKKDAEQKAAAMALERLKAG